MDWSDDLLACQEMLEDEDTMDLEAEAEEEEEEEGAFDDDFNCGPSLQLTPEEQNRVALEDRDADAGFRAMLRQELARPDFSCGYEYVKYRRVLVDWMSDVGEGHLGMRKELVHAAVALLERVLATDAPLPPKDRFQLLALSCLRVAIKSQGTDAELPPTVEFWEIGNRMYSFDEITDMEASVCRALDWRLTAVTPMHFLQTFLAQTVLFSDDEILGGVDLVDEAHGYYGKYADFFADLALQEYAFQAFRPSVVAAATLAAARKALGVAPLWREELSVLSGYSAEQVEPCFTALWTHYVATFGKGVEREEESPACVTEIWP